VHHQPLISERLLGLKKEQRPKRKKKLKTSSTIHCKKRQKFLPSREDEGGKILSQWRKGWQEWTERQTQRHRAMLGCNKTHENI
jgi:hypothetical protein